jgi:glycine/D-amino acid oxidase-like deaminating enzyme
MSSYAGVRRHSRCARVRRARGSSRATSWSPGRSLSPLPAMAAPLATQLEDDRLLAGGTLDAGDATGGVRTEVTDRIRAGLAAALPALAGVRLTHRWCCRRPRHPDGLPVIDRLPGLGSAWITSGHYRTGILAGPAAGAMLARWIASGQRPASAERPVRRPRRRSRARHVARYRTADILQRYARTRLLSVMVFPSGHVLSWPGPRAAAGSG